MSLSEFELIERFFTDPSKQRADVVTGVGDDGAVVRVPAGCDRVGACATITANSPNINTENPRAIGHRVASTALNRLAARGAEPAWMTLSLTVPQANESWLEPFSRGMLELAHRVDVSLIGGDTTRGPLTVTVMIDGTVPVGFEFSGPRPDDLVCVTGVLGAAGNALVVTAAPQRLTDEERRDALHHLEYPEPRLEVGVALRGLATAAADLTEGVGHGIEHLLAGTASGITVELSKLPLAGPLREQMSLTRTRRPALALLGDHELMFTLPAHGLGRMSTCFAELGIPCAVVGRIDARAGVRLLDLGEKA